MDVMSFVVGSMVVLVAVVVGAGVVILMHHLDMHDKSAQKREENTVFVQQASTPKHAQLLPPTFKEQTVTGSAPTRPGTAVPVRSVPTSAATSSPTNVPVDVTFDDLTAPQTRGGN